MPCSLSDKFNPTPMPSCFWRRHCLCIRLVSDMWSPLHNALIVTRCKLSGAVFVRVRVTSNVFVGSASATHEGRGHKLSIQATVHIIPRAALLFQYLVMKSCEHGNNVYSNIFLPGCISTPFLNVKNHPIAKCINNKLVSVQHTIFDIETPEAAACVGFQLSHCQAVEVYTSRP